jgi:signal transduction histidine kinase
VRRAPFFKSLSFKLGALIFLVVTGAMAIAYLAVVPRLESRLVHGTYDSLTRSFGLIEVALASNSPFEYQLVAQEFQNQLNARVVIYQVLGSGTAVPIADSNAVRSDDLQTDQVVSAALASGQTSRGRVERDGRELAEVAAPLPIGTGGGTVVLLSAPLADRLSAVDVVRRDLLIYGGVAIAVSSLAGVLVALRLTRRIGRLEAAAERLADGDFAVTVSDRSKDEVGQLARTFDRMRVRLSDLDRARREFVQNASHELRTPLFALGGFLELLSDEDLDEGTRRDFLETARGQVARLTRLATDLLDLSRLDAGQVGLETEAVDLGQVAHALVDEFRPLAEASGHALDVVTTGDVLGVGDGERVLQIGRSLVENALRHTPAGTEISVKAAVWVDRAELSVHDNGMGIRSEDQERVFDRFYRGEGSAAFGSGIGLTIARELAQRMEGAIELRSQPGDTTFTLVLRRAPTPAAFSREKALA